MYRTLIAFFLIHFAFAVATAQEIPVECGESGEVPVGGCLAESESYVYEEEFNGRSTDGTNLTTNDNDISFVIPEAYYNQRKLTWNAPTLEPGNIRIGISIFGVVGTADPLAGALSYCTLDTNTPLGGKCHLHVGEYAYNASYGGREPLCSITDPSGSGYTGGAPTTTTLVPPPTTTAYVGPTTTTLPAHSAGSCWLTAPGNRTVRSEPTTPLCSRSGIVSKTCLVSAAYFYTTELGGRSRNCTEGANSIPCWLNVASATLGVSNTCNENSTNNGYNSGSCRTAAANRYVYGNNKGGRANDCLDNDGGYCWVATASKSALSIGLTATNIRRNKVIFGITGTYDGTAFTWGSGAHHVKSSGGDNRITYTDEIATAPASNLPVAYLPVPKISVSTDGYNQVTQVSAVDRTSWGSTACGASGNLATRIANCQTVFNGLGSGPQWLGARSGNAGQGAWRLVSRRWVTTVTPNRAYEVWQDMATGLLWSSHVSPNAGLGWCAASGNSNSSNVPVEQREEDPSGICNSALYQSVGANNAISACYEAAGYSNTGTLPNGKSGLSISNSAAAGKVAWRLPTMHDYILANHHGLRFVLPDTTTKGEEWTATTFSQDRSKAWTFDGSTGSRQTRDRRWSYAVRCVGR